MWLLSQAGKKDDEAEGHQGNMVTQVLQQLVGGQDVYGEAVDKPVHCLWASPCFMVVYLEHIRTIWPILSLSTFIKILHSTVFYFISSINPLSKLFIQTGVAGVLEPVVAVTGRKVAGLSVNI